MRKRSVLTISIVLNEMLLIKMRNNENILHKTSKYLSKMCGSEMGEIQYGILNNQPHID